MTDLLRGFDISAYQGTEDLAVMVPTYALDFVICRAWQSNSQRDPAFPRYWRQLADLDVVRGAYGFAHSGTSPTKSADGLVDYVLEKGLRPTDLLVLDLESNLGNLSAPALAAWAIAWAERVTARCPEHKPVYYGGYPVHAQYKAFPQHFSAWWWARYPAALSQRTAWPRQMLSPGPNYWPGGPHIWQFSQDYPVGPNDPHDANVSSLTREQLRSLNPGAADMPLSDADFARLKAELVPAIVDALLRDKPADKGGATFRVHRPGPDPSTVTITDALSNIWARVEALEGGVPPQPAGLDLAAIRGAVSDVISHAVVTTSTTITAP